MGRRLKRSEWICESVCAPEGHKLSIDLMPWWRQIYDRSFKNWHHSVLLSGRQCGKSTTAIAMMITDIMRPNTTVIYAMPTDPHVAELSKTRFSPMWASIVRGKPDIIVDNVHEKSFSNGSNILFKYLYGGRSGLRARGTTANALYLDEIQNIVVDQISIIQETLAFRLYEGQQKWQTFAGTHMSRLSAPNVYWQMSTKREWFIHCCCGHWNFPDESLIGDRFLVCSSCGGRLDPRDGQWVRTGPDDATWEGFRIPQILSPFVPFDAGVADSINDKRKKYSRQRFLNEVMCMPYDAGVLWITPNELRSIMTPEVKYYNIIDNIEAGSYFMGIDWGSAESSGNSNTVVTIVMVRAGLVEVRHIRKFDAGEGDFDYQLEQIRQLADKFDINVICADWGFGAFQNQRLRKMCKAQLIEVMYTSQSAFASYNRKDGRWHVDRTQALDDLKMDLVDHKNILFPPQEYVQHIEKEFYSLERVEDIDKGKVSYEHDQQNPDDAVHSLFYAVFAAKRYVHL